jgi:S1-C subfamily serine protease
MVCRAHRLWFVLAVLALLVACGGSPPPEPTAAPEPTATPEPTLTPEPTAVPEPTATPEPKGPWQRAVVLIEVEGTSFIPGAGLQTSPSKGSGFIIDQAGTIVTNNHVVAGAESIKVYVLNDDLKTSKSYRAKLIGVSECSDLAVIRITNGDDDFVFLDWSDATITTDTRVRAAGYPSDNTNLAVTSGFIVETDSNGKTQWASVESVLRHDADIEPGSSGGPLIDAETRQVVGVNYRVFASDDPRFVNRFYAIGSSEAKDLVAQLEDGEDAGSIGISGTAFTFEDLSGILVETVRTNTPANDLGLQPGDIITSIDGTAVGSDATMGEYCEIVRDRGNETLDIEVLRLTTEPYQMLTGQLNGTELELAEAFSTQIVETNFTEEEANQVRAVHDQLVSQYQQTILETFDRGLRTRRAWPDGDQRGRLRDNRYEFTIADPDAVIYESWNQELGDNYMLEATVRFPSLSPLAEVGLMFEQSADNQQKMYYVMRSNGTWGIYRNNDLLAEGPTPANFAINPDTDYSLWVMRLPNVTTFFFNGVPVAGILGENMETSGGFAGVAGISTSEGNAFAVADNFVIFEPR